MKKIALSLFISALSSLAGCSNLFVSYCDRVAKGTADKTWIVDSMTSTVPFSKPSYRDPQASGPGAVCVTSQGETQEKAAGKNFSYEITDASDKVLVKKSGSSTAQPINRENQLKLWGGTSATNKNNFESTDCFNIPKLDPFVVVKVKNLSTGETDQAKLWNNAAFCKDRKRIN